MISAVASALALSALAATAGPCDLLDRAAAAKLLGAAVTQMDPSGPEPDEDTGASRSTCVYMAGQRMLVVIRLDFPSAAAASEMTTTELQGERLTAENATVKEETGAGDKAWLVRTPKALEYIVLKGPTVLTLALGGVPAPLDAYEAQLRTDGKAAAAKL